MPSLSFCMIVRDEEAVLPRLLTQVAGRFDQLVAIDTGSRDTSPRLLAEAGFEVHCAAWPNDFAAARNLSLERATGDWILVLDADEQLEEGAVDRLRELAARTPAHVLGYTLAFRNYSSDVRDLGWQRLSADEQRIWGATGYYPTEVTRFFRNDPRIRYRGRIHELVEHSIEEAGGAILPASVTIHHHLKEHIDSDGRSKAERYLELQERKVEEHPDDAKAHWELGALHLANGDSRAAERVFARAWQLAPGNLEAGLGYATALNECGRHADALGVLEALPSVTGGDSRAEFQRGMALALLDRRDEARAAFERAHASASHLSQPLHWLARLALDAGDPVQATRYSRELARVAPEFWPGLVLEVAIAARAHRTLDAVSRFLHALDRAPAASDRERQNAVGVVADLYELLERGTPSIGDRVFDATALRLEHALLAADALLLLRHHDRALRLVRNAMRCHGDSPRLRLRSARAHAALGASADALREYESCFAENAVVAEAAYEAAQIAIGNGDLARGAACLGETLRCEPRHVRALTDLAGLHGNSGRVETAEQLLLRAHEIEPRNPFVLRNLAIAALLSNPPRPVVAREHAAAAERLGTPVGSEIEQQIEQMLGQMVG